jgi:hypothetical protein
MESMENDGADLGKEMVRCKIGRRKANLCLSNVIGI